MNSQVRQNATVSVLDEPLLEFASGQLAVDPHDGLALFGPHSLSLPAHPQSPSYLMIGTRPGLALADEWALAMNSSASAPDPKTHRLWPPYPGFETAFGSRWPSRAVVRHEINADSLIQASRRGDPYERASEVVGLYLAGFERAQKEDAKLSVALCIVPDEVHANCRPESRVESPPEDRTNKKTQKSRQKGQFELFDDVDLAPYQYSTDFRRQIKARSMQYDIPVQIIRESTLRLSDEWRFGERRLTRLSDRMWNLSSALYYKCGGKPWKLSGAREGVCYIGIAFRLTHQDANTACCAAQMFLDSGDGVVFLGEFGPWYSPERKQFHLSREAAKSLLQGVLATYASLEGKPLREVFLHSRSSINREEFAGFQDACPPGCKLVGIRVRSDSYGPRLFRIGTRPVLRGTFLRTDDRSGLLYASGFKPRIGTYDGWETPVPLRVDIQHGEAAIEDVAQDIFGLTKLNYNACKLGDGQPVTVGFSDAVGEILISNARVPVRRANFKFYI